MPVAAQTSRRHHFVPAFILSPWCVEEPAGQWNLAGYHWDDRLKKISVKRRGPKWFCNVIDLFTLRQHSLGRDAIERMFFGEIDQKGSVARDVLLGDGVSALDAAKRVDWVRLILSLVARRPENVSRLKNDGPRTLAEGIDRDPEIQAAFTKYGIGVSPSAFAQQQMGMDFTDRSIALIQGLVDNKDVGERLLNAHWHVVRLRPSDGTLVTADRPVIRLFGYSEPGAVWVLPISPQAAFVAANHRENLRSIVRVSGARFVRALNVASAGQAQMYVFSTSSAHERWLGKYLRRPEVG